MVAHAPYYPSTSHVTRWRRIARFRGERDTENLFRRIEALYAELVDQSATELLPDNWLLSFREDFRKAIRRRDVSTIQLFLAKCSDDLKPIAVSLLGRCAYRTRLLSLADLRWDLSAKVRTRVARSLWRLEAWHLLDEMAVEFPNDEKVQWYARVRAPCSRRPFAERISRFTRHLDNSSSGVDAGPSRMPYWSRFEPWQGRPAKGAQYIRSLLERIRLWVHGK
jgi:hypothetical protein